MLAVCFPQDYKIPLTEAQLEELCNEIIHQVTAKIVFLDLLLLDKVAKGFISYQVDTPMSDWCEKENWGFIREIFIAPDIRKMGYGKILVEHAERKLTDLSVPNIYLTTDDSIDFWINVGYQKTGEVSEKNKGYILIK